jgi:hypothetical protein
MPSTRTRRIALALAAAASVSALTAGAASAATTANVHKTPKLPVVIDGKRLPAKAIHRFDGREIHLKLRKAADGKQELVVSLKAPKLKKSSKKARASSPGGYVRFYDGVNGTGGNFYRYHAQSISNLATVPQGCFIFCWGHWDDQITSVETNGAHTMLFDGKNFTGSSLSIPQEWTRRADLGLFGFNNRTSSLWVD